MGAIAGRRQHAEIEQTAQLANQGLGARARSASSKTTCSRRRGVP
jgi:hypothetical protein